MLLAGTRRRLSENVLLLRSASGHSMEVNPRDVRPNPIAKKKRILRYNGFKRSRA